MNENIWASTQLNEKQAISMFESKEWEKWDDEQIVKFQLFQKRLCVPFSRFHEAIEKVLNRPVFTHEFGMDYEGIVMEYLGEKPSPSLEEIINLIPEEKRLIIGI